MTWYPNIKDDAFPWSLVYLPTEPLLAPTRKLITPVGCVVERRTASQLTGRSLRPQSLYIGEWTCRPSCGWLCSRS